MRHRVRNYLPHAIYINCRNHRLALCFKHVHNDFPWLETIDSILLGLWEAFHFSSKNRFIFNKIQEVYGLKTLSIIKAAITRWLSLGGDYKRCCEHYCFTLESLDDIITNDPKAELTEIHDQLLQQDTIMHICFLEDVLSVMNVLSLVLQSNHKDFGALRRPVKYTISQLEQIQENVRGPLMKSFQKVEELTQNIERYCCQNVIGHSARKRLGFTKFKVLDNLVKKIQPCQAWKFCRNNCYFPNIVSTKFE